MSRRAARTGAFSLNNSHLDLLVLVFFGAFGHVRRALPMGLVADGCRRGTGADDGADAPPGAAPHARSASSTSSRAGRRRRSSPWRLPRCSARLSFASRAAGASPPVALSAP